MNTSIRQALPLLAGLLASVYAASLQAADERSDPQTSTSTGAATSPAAKRPVPMAVPRNLGPAVAAPAPRRAVQRPAPRVNRSPASETAKAIKAVPAIKPALKPPLKASPSSDDPKAGAQGNSGRPQQALPRGPGGARWSPPPKLTGRGGATMMKPKNEGLGSGSTPRPPFAHNPGRPSYGAFGGVFGDDKDATKNVSAPFAGNPDARPDGSAVVHDEYGGRLETGPGTKSERSSTGGTTVDDADSGVTAHFGAGKSSYVQGGSKDDASPGDAASGSSKDSSGSSGGGKDDSSGNADSEDSDSKDADSADGKDKDEADSGGDSDETSIGESSGGASAPAARGIAQRTDPGYRQRDGECSGQPAGGGPPDGVTQPGVGQGSTARGDCESGLRGGQADAGGRHATIPVWSGPDAGRDTRRGGLPGSVVNPARIDDGGIGGPAHDPFDAAGATTNPTPNP